MASGHRAIAGASSVIALLAACSATVVEPPPSATHRAEPRKPAPAATEAPLPSPKPAARAVASSSRFLKGQTHVHTGRSYDAKTPPDQVLGFYAARGYDFVAITDHNRITVVEPPAGLLLVPGVELTQNSASCDPKPAPGYRCLFHTTALFVDPDKDRARGERFQIPYRPGRLAAYGSQLEIVRELGAMPVLNHPLFHFAADAKLVSTLAKNELRLVELFNASLDRQHPGGRDRAERRAEQLWDEVLTAGTLVYALASDDSHHFSDAAERRRIGKFAYDGDRAWVMVRAEKTLAAIERALSNGDFYASTGVVLAELERSRTGIALRVDSATPGEPVTRFIGAGGRELARVAGREARHELSGDSSYVRAVVESSDGRKAWIQPVVR